MKKHIKKFILVLIVLISFSQFACGKAINLSFDKSSPSTLTISVDGKLKKIYFASSTDSEEIEDFNDLYSNGKITLDSSFFANYENGTYKLTVKAKSTKTYYIKVSGVAYAFNMVNKKDIFNRCPVNHNGCHRLCYDILYEQNSYRIYNGQRDRRNGFRSIF